ncbi:MAG: hypothetical protein KGJ49_05980 [Alphaproteobacteria bacterium]|nr:hypothetical protein [Alphaproteobacteria bacterium]
MSTPDSRYLMRNLSCPIVEFMRFRLVWSGSLRSSGNTSKPEDVRAIRDEIHPQIEQLWQTHIALKRLKFTSQIERGGSRGTVTSWAPLHRIPDREPPKWATQAPQGFVDLCEPIKVGERTVIPLVRKSLSLACRLTVLFLREEDPGALFFKAGDLDGRLKTLLDALKMPSPADDAKYPSAHDPLYCLMESDTLVTRFDVETDRLLTPQTPKATNVQLVVEVSIDVLEVGDWNVCLVGG